MRRCSACGGEVQDEFRFCPHCGKAQRTKIVEYFRGHPDGGEGARRVPVSLTEPHHARLSVGHGEEAEAAISLDPDESGRLARFLLATLRRPRGSRVRELLHL